MKTRLFKMVSSFLAIVSFLFISNGYDGFFLGGDLPDFAYLGNGIYEEGQYDVGGQKIWSITGRRDIYGNWEGNCIHEGQTYTQKVTYVNGKKHGKSEVKYKSDGFIKYICYNMEQVVPCEGNVVSDIADSRIGLTAFEILNQKYPWYILENLSENKSLKDSFELYMTAIEKNLDTYTLNKDNFETYYSDVIGSDAIIDSFGNISNWYQLSGRFASGESEARDFEFRRALVDRYIKTKIPIADIIQNKYPYFSKQVEHGFNISAAELNAFCHEFDSKMDAKINIPVSDPFFIDSLDSWMGQIFTEYLEDDNNLIFKKFKIFLSQPTLYYNRYDISVQNMFTEYLQKNLTDTVPVHEAVLILLFTKVLEVDAIKLSIRESCFNNQNVPLPPEIVTNILGQNTESIKVRGLITFDGNAAITKSGIVWDTVYNPELTPNNIINPGNTYDFSVFIDNLVPGKKYFVRSYAVNKVGMVYGNTLEFIAGEVSSNKDIIPADLGCKVYPNPANNQFNIAFEEPLAKVEVIIYTLNGRDIFHKSYNNIEDIKVHSADWPAGTYTIVLKGPNFKQSKRIILQR